MGRVPTFLVVIALWLTASVAVAGEDASRLTVRGEAQVEVAADQVTMDVAVVTRAKSVDEALQQNSERMEKVEAALRHIGLGEGEYRTGQFRIQPEWNRRPKGALADWQPEIAGYTVRNSLQVKTKQLQKAGDIVEEAIAAGANAVDSIRFGLADPRAQRAGVIAMAVANARSDASALAGAAAVKLVKLLAINLDHADVALPGPRMMMAETMAAKAAAPPLVPGEVTVRAAVTLAYEVTP